MWQRGVDQNHALASAGHSQFSLLTCALLRASRAVLSAISPRSSGESPRTKSRWWAESGRARSFWCWTLVRQSITCPSRIALWLARQRGGNTDSPTVFHTKCVSHGSALCLAPLQTTLCTITAARQKTSNRYRFFVSHSYSDSGQNHYPDGGVVVMHTAPQHGGFAFAYYGYCGAADTASPAQLLGQRI